MGSVSTFLREWGMNLFQTPLVTPIGGTTRRVKGDGINSLPNSLLIILFLIFVVMVELIDLVMNKLYSDIKYDINYVIFNNFKGQYVVIVKNIYVTYDPITFEPIGRYVSSDNINNIDINRLERDLLYFAGVDVKIRNSI